MKVRIVLFLFFLAPLVSSYAQPSVTSVTGTAQHGASIQIGGSGFGTKVPVAPYIYDNFESGIPGQVVSGGWFVDASSSGKRPKYSDANPRFAQARAVLQDFTEGNYNSTLGLVGQNSKTFYVSGWNYTHTWNAPSRNFKPLGFRSGPAGDWGEPEGRLDIYPVNGPGSGHMYAADCNNTSSVNVWGFNDGFAWTYDRWWRMETWIDQGSMDSSDGLWQFWEDLRLDKQISGTFITSEGCVGLACRVRQTPVPTPSPQPTPLPVVCQCASETCEDYDNFYLSSYFATDQGSPVPHALIYWDEIYIDYTRARVEIGNASTWDACTHREIQIPSAWSENSVTVTVNSGSFIPGSQAYVFVVNADGVPAASGFPVVIGNSMPDAAFPAAPSNLRIQ